MQINLILALVAVLGPLATWGLTSVKAGFDQRAAVLVAVTAAETRERSACQAQVSDIQTRLNNANAEAQRLAAEADREHKPTPVEAAELTDLCNASASCRSRKKEMKK